MPLAAPGGAITAELCGHWEHEGPCRWPHRTEVHRQGDLVHVRTRFNAAPEEEDQVRERIRAALGRGELKGPDGRISSWQLVDG